MAALLALLAFGVQVVLAVPLGIIDVVCEQALHRAPLHLARQPLVIGCINLVAFGGAIALGLYLNHLPFRRAFPFGRITARQVVGAAITILGAGVLLSEGDNVLRALVPPPEWLLDALKDVFFAQDRFLSRGLLLVIIAPVTEELLFRGIILRGLLSRYRPAVAVTLTALLFAAVHANPWQFLSPLFLGIAFGWFYLRTGSLGLCVLAHAMANGLALAGTLIPWDIPGMTGTPDRTVAVFQPWWLDLLGLAVLLAGLWIFSRAAPRVGEPAEPPRLPPVITDQLAKFEAAAGAASSTPPPAS